MEPLVSILIPAYNAEAFIADTIGSALAQTWPKKEIIVVDDGSSDQTVAVARRFEPEGVRVVTQPNRGASAARNLAFSLCRGDYIQWLDADDLLSPDKISKQLEAAKKNPNKRRLFSSAWGRFLYRPHKTRFCPSSLWCDLPPIEWLLRKMENEVFMQTSTWLVSRELTEAAGPWDTRLSLDDDGEYFCRVLLASDGTCFVPEGKTYYRITGSGSLSYTGLSGRKLESQFLSCQLHIEYVQSLERSPRSRAACVKYLQKYLSYFYRQRPDLVDQLGQLAQHLGGQLQSPRLGWKYTWLHRALGWTAARRAQVSYNRVKWALMRCWDKALLHSDRWLSPKNRFANQNAQHG